MEHWRFASIRPSCCLHTIFCVESVLSINSSAVDELSDVRDMRLMHY